MLEKISGSFIDWLEEKELTNCYEREEYMYALLVTLEGLVVTIIMLLIGMGLGRCIETIIFLIFFYSLRKRTGGYHAGSFRVCFIATIITFVVALNVAEYLADNYVVMYVACSMATCIIGMVGTVNHPNMDMDNSELKESRRKARYILVQELIVIIILEILEVERVYIACIVVAIILCSILIFLAKINKQEVCFYEE